MEQFTIYCTKSQARKALELGAPLLRRYIDNGQKCFYVDPEKEFPHPYLIPTAEEMIGWLRSKGFKFLLSDEPDIDGCHWFVGYGTDAESVSFGQNKDNKELAAIDAALNYLAENNLQK